MVSHTSHGEAHRAPACPGGCVCSDRPVPCMRFTSNFQDQQQVMVGTLLDRPSPKVHTPLEAQEGIHEALLVEIAAERPTRRHVDFRCPDTVGSHCPARVLSGFLPFPAPESTVDRSTAWPNVCPPPSLHVLSTTTCGRHIPTPPSRPRSLVSATDLSGSVSLERGVET